MSSLSIVIPVLNEAAGITAVLDALQAECRAAQAAPPAFPGGIEVLVADGGSTDGTPALCAGRVDRIVAAPARPGPPDERRRPRQRAARVLLFLHADTRLAAGGLRVLAQVLAARPGARWGRHDVHIVGRSRWLPVVAAMMNWRSAWSGIATGDQAMVVRRASFDAVGGFPDQPLMEDIELSRRLRALPGGHPLRLR